jgi:hypothetical protein
MNLYLHFSIRHDGTVGYIACVLTGPTVSLRLEPRGTECGREAGGERRAGSSVSAWPANSRKRSQRQY